MSNTDKHWMPDHTTMVHNLRMIMGTVAMPANYLVLDLETTGVEPRTGYIWQIGFYPVINCVAKHEYGMAIQLKQSEYIAKTAKFEIDRRTEKLAAEAMAAGRDVKENFYKQAESQFVDLLSSGVEPAEGLALAAETIRACVDSGYYLVGQNFVKFDIPFLVWACKSIVISLEFPKRNLIDTGMLIKAGKLKRRMLDRETPSAFYSRIAGQRARGCYYALERFAIPAYHLDTRHGVDTTKTHDAGYDCWITALLLQELVDQVAAAA